MRVSVRLENDPVDKKQGIRFQGGIIIAIVFLLDRNRSSCGNAAGHFTTCKVREPYAENGYRCTCAGAIIQRIEHRDSRTDTKVVGKCINDKSRGKVLPFRCLSSTSIGSRYRRIWRFVKISILFLLSNRNGWIIRRINLGIGFRNIFGGITFVFVSILR